MDPVTPITEAVKLLWVPLSRQLRYLKDLEENVKVLGIKRDELTSLEKDVSVEIERANLQGRNSKEEVKNWLDNVNELIVKVNEIEKEFGENKRCMMGCLPNCSSRRKLGKEAIKLIVAVDELKERGSFEGGVAVDQLPTAMRYLRTMSLLGTTPEMTFRNILSCLMDEKAASIIGVYGMGGIGKTSIMKNINNYLNKEKSFNAVIMVTVSQNLNLKSLQCDIAKQIGLASPEEHNEETLSTKLYEALLRKKKFLLILDDMWSRLSLEDVGIPKPNVDNGCKIVLTTRSLGVCQCMETQKNIKVEILSPEEAWLLFQEKVGTNVLLDSCVQDVAKQVAEECAGLPIAIITVGWALRDVEDVREWRNALNILKNSITDIAGMEDDVLKRLKFSYDRLRSEKLRICFLYCLLFPEDYEINADMLIDNWIGEGIINQWGNRQSLVDNGRSLLNELKRACLLEIDEDYDTVKMHDLMRDMAIGITRNDPRFMVKLGSD